MKTGKLSENIYRRSVVKELQYQRDEVINGAGVGEDCAVLLFGEGEAYVTGSAVVTGDVKEFGGLGVYRAANGIAASGAEPVAVTASLSLPEEIPEEELKKMIRRIEETCAKIKVQAAAVNVITAQAAVQPILTVTGIGKVKTDHIHHTFLARPHQDVIVSKWIGMEGTFLIAKEKKQELQKRFSADYIERACGFDRYFSILPEAATAVKSDAGAMQSAAEGGIFAALWQMAESSGVGLEIELKKIPIRQETVEICNYYDLNPYCLFSSGCLLMTAENGQELTAVLKKEGIEATVIGRTTDSNDRLILNEEEKRFLTPAQPDELYKIK